jgi:YVTN family beta-propeller protein
MIPHGTKALGHFVLPSFHGLGRPIRPRVLLLLALAAFSVGTHAAFARRTHAPAHTIEVGHHPDAVAVDPSNHVVYVVSGADDDVSVVSGSTEKVVHTIPVGHHPDAVAVDPATHTVYVANNADDDVSVIIEGTGGR